MLNENSPLDNILESVLDNNPIALKKALSEVLAVKLQEAIAEKWEDSLQEISKKTLGSYINKATQDAVRNAANSGYVDLTAKNGTKDYNNYVDKAKSRMAGIRKATNKLTKEDADLTEATTGKHSISSEHKVYVYGDHPETHAFAKLYTNAKKHDEGIENKTTSKALETLHNDYKSKIKTHGFAGSGVTHYVHKASGVTFEVRRNANGKGFYGTDHVITHMGKE